MNFKVYNTYISSEQAWLFGLSIRWPPRSSVRKLMGGIPRQGCLPPLNISQHVTPNDHCMSKDCGLINTALKYHLYFVFFHTTSVFSVKIECSTLSNAIHFMGSLASSFLTCLKYCFSYMHSDRPKSATLMNPSPSILALMKRKYY